ncbi:hypothetical protein D1013_15460 [Euzebyella marina]|uniref:Uncharacterized protein n=1 Tax=Euzebyella marina TaxID=1761453 RepID=A0A3G2L8U6_9FLAO|nr:hypothetical protein [Euzebyella marina]AYN68676.1 hypothetical protein D1013_15460 [Euzebyella marina]
MKTVTTLFFVLFLGFQASAKIPTHDVKVDVIKMDIVLVDSSDNLESFEKAQVNSPKGIARLYKSKNSRIKKELTFTTKYNRSKLA